MSLANTCDRCKKVINGPAMTDKDDFDVSVMIDGEPYYECEDICPECRAELVSMINGFRSFQSPVRRNVHVEKTAQKTEDDDSPDNTKTEPKNTAPQSNEPMVERQAYRSLTESELPNAVTKRYPLPVPSTPTRETSPKETS